MHVSPIRLGAVLWSLLLLVAGLWLLHALTVRGLPDAVRFEVAWPGLADEEQAAAELAVEELAAEPAGAADETVADPPTDGTRTSDAGASDTEASDTESSDTGAPDAVLDAGDLPAEPTATDPAPDPEGAATLALAGGAAAPAVLEPGAWREDAALASRERMIAAAAETFDLPADWVAAVLWAADAPALDPPDGIGVLPVPAETYRTLAQAFDLSEPAGEPDEADAILVGAAYLRMLYEMFGEPGFLAGYHLGAVPYGRLLFAQDDLPAETRAFVDALLPRLAGTRPADADGPRPPDLERFMRLVTLR